MTLALLPLSIISDFKNSKYFSRVQAFFLEELEAFIERLVKMVLKTT
jgi:hypothetical protein